MPHAPPRLEKDKAGLWGNPLCPIEREKGRGAVDGVQFSPAGAVPAAVGAGEGRRDALGSPRNGL